MFEHFLLCLTAGNAVVYNCLVRQGIECVLLWKAQPGFINPIR